MAITDIQSTLPPSIRDRLHQLRQQWQEDKARRAEYRRVRGELSRLSDRDLADINIHRANIEDIALEASRMI